MLSEQEMDAVLQALGNESRRRMLDIVKAKPGIAVGALAREFDVSRIAVMKHLAVLEEAHLIVSEKDGRLRKLYINAVPIQLLHERWTTEYSAYWACHVTRIKSLAEARSRGDDKGGERSR